MPPGEVRFQRLSLAVAGNDRFVASSVELERSNDEPSYTVDTINYFQEHLERSTGGPVKINLLLGADNVIQLPTWHDYGKIFARTRLLIAPRLPKRTVANETMVWDGLSAEELQILINADYALMDFPLLSISSTDIEQCLKAGKSIRYLVPEALYEQTKKGYSS